MAEQDVKQQTIGDAIKDAETDGAANMTGDEVRNEEVRNEALDTEQQDKAQSGDDKQSVEDKPKINRAALRIIQLNAKYRAEEAARKRAEQELTELKARLAVSDGDEPQRDNTENKIRDIVASEVEKALFAERLRVASKSYDDWDEAIAIAKEIPILDKNMRAIMKSDAAPEIVYAMGKDPELALRIANGSYEDALREIAIIEHTAKRRAVTKPTTSAPPPVKPVGGSAKATKSPNDMNMNEYIAWRASKST